MKLITEETPIEEVNIPLIDLIEDRIVNIIQQDDRPAVVFCLEEQVEEVQATIGALKEREPRYALILESLPIQARPDTDGQVLIVSYNQLSAEFLSNYFNGYLTWLHKDFSESLGIPVPILPKMPELKTLFLLDTYLLWRSQMAVRKSNSIIVPSISSEMKL